MVLDRCNEYLLIITTSAPLHYISEPNILYTCNMSVTVVVIGYFKCLHAN